MVLLGNLRKRWVLTAIFLTSVMYFVYNMSPISARKLASTSRLLQNSRSHANAENILRNLKWHGSSKLHHNETEGFSVNANTCRNSLQGKNIIADDEGFVCKREDTKNTGCCDMLALSTNRYECSSCLSTNCCSVYEHCVSCCMKPDRRRLLEKIIRETANNLQQMIFATVEDQFDLCLTKCRTSSNSVQHENTYRDANFKFCYGRSIPEIQLT